MEPTVWDRNQELEPTCNLSGPFEKFDGHESDLEWI